MLLDELSFNYIPKNVYGMLDKMLNIVKSDKRFFELIKQNVTQYKNPEIYSKYGVPFKLEVSNNFSIVEFDLRRAVINVLKHFYPQFYKTIEEKGCLREIDKKDKKEIYKCVNLTLESVLGSKENLSLLLSDIEKIFKLLLFSHIISVGKPYSLVKFVRDGALVIMEDFNPYENSIASLYFIEIKAKVLERYLYFGRKGEIYFYVGGRAEFKGTIKNLSNFLKSIASLKVSYGILLDKISSIEKEIRKYYDVLSNEEIKELVKDVYLSEDETKVFISSKKMYVPIEQIKGNLKFVFNPHSYNFYSIYDEIIYPIVRTLIH